MRPAALILIALILPTGACAPKAATDLKPINHEPVQAGELGIRQQREVLEAMASTAPDHHPAALPASRLRWEDVRRAAELAAERMEMAISRYKRTEHGWIFTLKTIDDRWGELVVERIDGPQVYSAAARIGRLESDDRRAASLLEQFDRFMRQLGDKRHVKDPRH